MTPSDPRTVIAVTLAGVLSENREITRLSLQISEQLAHWLTKEAIATPDAASVPGYLELARRLTAR